MDLVSQNLLMTSGGKKAPTYIDDVFSTYLYKGTGSAKTINNGIDLVGEGGMTWIKDRTNAYNHVLQDTVRGAGATTKLASNLSAAQSGGDNAIQWSGYISAFNNTGFSLDKTGSGSIDWANVNKSNDNYASWTFRKAKGFFDVVTWTGNDTAGRQISHNLKSIPGCILVKTTSSSSNWMVYHRGIGAGQRLKLDSTTSSAGSNAWNNVTATSTYFELGSSEVNAPGETYVAYIFAGGEEQGNASVNFSGTNDRLTLDSTSDVNFGTGDFTVEFWLRKPDGGATHTGFFQISGTQGGLTTSYGSSLGLGWHQSFNCWQLYRGGAYTNSSSFTPTANQWYHAAVVRSSGTTKVYIDGSEVISLSDTHDYNYNNLVVGGYYSTDYLMKGNISNFRITKGQALYTSSFTPTTSPLTTTSQSATASNVKLLCCNDIGASGFTESPSPLTLTGSPQGIKVSPFAAATATDEGAVFGVEGDQNIIKCGSYIGNGSSTGPEINLGFEPQWLLVKNTNLNTEQWFIVDSMRGIISGANDPALEASRNVAENGYELIDLTATGFKVTTSDSKTNNNGGNYIYMAIRRPDPLVGKPAEVGTDAFAMDVSNASSTVPTFDSGFPVDFALARRPASTESWYTTSRLTGTKYLFTDTTAAEADLSLWEYDSNVGWSRGPLNNYQSWMWKRGAGFDVVTGNNLPLGASLSHNLGKTPEMIWAKNRNNTFVWAVYHKALNGGTNPEQYRLRLNTSDGEEQQSAAWNNTAPTATHFTVGENITGASGGADYKPIFMLFASVDGISKVGSYTGNGYAGHTITLGFQPRFLLVKNADRTGVNWLVYDTLRGWTGTDDKFISLNQDYGQGTTNIGPPTSTGFTVNATNTSLNASGENYIYYAHA